MKAKGKLESLNKEITEQDNALFMAINGLRLKPGMQRMCAQRSGILFEALLKAFKKVNLGTYNVTSTSQIA